MSSKNNKNGKSKKEETSSPEEQAPGEPESAPETAPDAREPAPETPEASEAAQTPESEAETGAEELARRLDEANDRYLRMLAEYDNYRRRSQKERQSIYADVRADTVGKLLPVYDNLLRAAEHESTEEARKGMEAIVSQFEAILAGIGVTAIEAVGKKFDPALHEALLHIEDEKYGESEIVLELERGFMLGDKVIRFSKVQVAN